MRFFAPAKINLSLRVLRRRADGFHEIETLMAPISLGDDIEIELGGDGVDFRCDAPGIPTDDTNLVVRAVKLFFAETGQPPAAQITLTKRVPHGAGLGGGSSDAATTLMALDEMLGTGCETAALAGMASKLGSDIPFFVYRAPAMCRGRGELVTPVKLSDPLPLLLLKPPFAVPTPWAYSRWADSLEIPDIDYAAQEFAGEVLVNDLERPVFEKFLFLAHLKQWLREQPETRAALMSGSGSTLFAVLRQETDGEELAGLAKAEFGESLWTHVCATA